MPGGRLTLASGTPVMTTSVINATSILYDCFHGANKVPVWDGTFDVELPIGGMRDFHGHDGWGGGKSDPCRQRL